jgi:hypothetical protein
VEGEVVNVICLSLLTCHGQAMGMKMLQRAMVEFTTAREEIMKRTEAEVIERRGIVCLPVTARMVVMRSVCCWLGDCPLRSGLTRLGQSSCIVTSLL